MTDRLTALLRDPKVRDALDRFGDDWQTDGQSVAEHILLKALLAADAAPEERKAAALLSTTQAALLRTAEGSRKLEEALTHIANAIPDSWAGKRARAALNGEEFHDAALGT